MNMPGVGTVYGEHVGVDNSNHVCTISVKQGVGGLHNLVQCWCHPIGVLI